MILALVKGDLAAAGPRCVPCRPRADLTSLHSRAPRTGSPRDGRGDLRSARIDCVICLSVSNRSPPACGSPATTQVAPPDGVLRSSFRSDDDAEIAEFIRQTYADDQWRFAPIRAGAHFSALTDDTAVIAADRVRTTIDYGGRAPDGFHDCVFFVVHAGSVPVASRAAGALASRGDVASTPRRTGRVRDAPLRRHHVERRPSPSPAATRTTRVRHRRPHLRTRPRGARYLRPPSSAGVRTASRHTSSVGCGARSCRRVSHRVATPAA